MSFNMVLYGIRIASVIRIPSNTLLDLNDMKNKKDQIVNADTEDGQLAGEAMVEVIENQLQENNPPETKKTLERLIELGESRENAIRYIASALSVEIFGALKHREAFNLDRYIINLNALPDLPYE